MIVSDDPADVEAELLEGGVTARLFLQLSQPDVPLLLIATVFTADLVQASFQGAAQRA